MTALQYADPDNACELTCEKWRKPATPPLPDLVRNMRIPRATEVVTLFGRPVVCGYRGAIVQVPEN